MQESKRGMPKPERWMVSTLGRTGQTCRLQWGWLFDESQLATGSGALAKVGESSESSSHGVPAVVIEVSSSLRIEMKR